MKKRICKILLLFAAVASGAMLLGGCSVLDKSNSASDSSNMSIGSDDPGNTVMGEGAASGEVQSGTATGEVSQHPEDSSGGPVGEVIPDEWADAAEAENAAEDKWSGRYVSESESVTVTLIDDETIAFSFAQSGISGNASVDGNQAVFNGDDYHVVVFSLNDTVLNIAVSSEEDFDASDSPLNGTFIRSAQ